MPDLLRIGFAILPLGCYWVVLGMLRFRKHPTILSRSFDLLLLGLGCTGLIAIGPIELFFPRAAFALVGNWVWLILLGLYALILLLVAFNTSAGFIAYGLNREGLKKLLSELLLSENIEHSWQGDCLSIPTRGIQGIVVDAGVKDTAAMHSISGQQYALQWVQLEMDVAKKAAETPIQKYSYREMLLAAGALLMGIALIGFVLQAEQLRDAISWLFD